MTRIPTYYSGPLQLPLYWRDEVSGELGRAVEAYLNNRVDGSAVTAGQIELLRDYLCHWVFAPCWDNPGNGALKALRKSVAGLKSAAEVDEWIHTALDIGLDPL